MSGFYGGEDCVVCNSKDSVSYIGDSKRFRLFGFCYECGFCYEHYTETDDSGKDLVKGGVSRNSLDNTNFNRANGRIENLEPLTKLKDMNMEVFNRESKEFEEHIENLNIELMAQQQQ